MEKKLQIRSQMKMLMGGRIEREYLSVKSIPTQKQPIHKMKLNFRDMTAFLELDSTALFFQDIVLLTLVQNTNQYNKFLRWPIKYISA